MAMIQIHFDRQNHNQYQPGETLTGTATVTVQKETKCKAININLGWYAHGKGNLSVENVRSIHPHEGGPLSVGTHTFDFSFILPKGPYSYRGNYTNIDWQIEVHVDIPWAIDANESRDFALVPGYLKNPPIPDNPAETVKDNNGSTMSAGAGIVLLISLLWWGFQFWDEGTVFNICSIIGFCLGGYFLYKGVHRFLATRLVGNVQFESHPWPAQAGQSFDHTIKFTPKSNMDVNSITAYLLGEEVVVEGSGTDSTTYRHTLYEETIKLSGETTLPRDELAVFKAPFILPRNAAYSFICSSNQVSWKVTTSIDIPNWPDWEDTHDVTVGPNYAEFEPAEEAPHHDELPEQGSSW